MAVKKTASSAAKKAAKTTYSRKKNPSKPRLRFATMEELASFMTEVHAETDARIAKAREETERVFQKSREEVDKALKKMSAAIDRTTANIERMSSNIGH
jgi:acyl-CoA reductase-like NAD-dependent aldehyde dehydrogenase